MPNVRRGFNRLYVVLSLVWAVYCLLIFPQQQKREAMAGYSDAVTVCYSGEYASQGARAECVRLAAEAFKSEVDNWSPKKFYLGAWWLLLLAIVVFPLIVYGFCLGLAAVSLWVWRGFGANAALG